MPIAGKNSGTRLAERFRAGVPKRYFFHFYLFGFVASALSLVDIILFGGSLFTAQVQVSSWWWCGGGKGGRGWGWRDKGVMMLMVMVVWSWSLLYCYWRWCGLVLLTFAAAVVVDGGVSAAVACSCCYCCCDLTNTANACLQRPCFVTFCHDRYILS